MYISVILMDKKIKKKHNLDSMKQFQHTTANFAINNYEQ